MKHGITALKYHNIHTRTYTGVIYKIYYYNNTLVTTLK